MKYSKYKVDKLEREQIQIVVPRCMRKEILIAAHQSPWSAHLGRNKLIIDLKIIIGRRREPILIIFVQHVRCINC